MRFLWGHWRWCLAVDCCLLLLVSPCYNEFDSCFKGERLWSRVSKWSDREVHCWWIRPFVPIILPSVWWGFFCSFISFYNSSFFMSMCPSAVVSILHVLKFQGTCASYHLLHSTASCTFSQTLFLHLPHLTIQLSLAFFPLFPAVIQLLPESSLPTFLHPQ